MSKPETPDRVASSAVVRRRLRVDELTRLAFVWAEQDRSSLAEAWPDGSPERTQHEWEWRQIKEYRTKRWGRTQMEAILSKAKTVDVLKRKAS